MLVPRCFKLVASWQLPLTQLNTKQHNLTEGMCRALSRSSYGKCCDVNYVIINVIAVTHSHTCTDTRAAYHILWLLAPLSIFVLSYFWYMERFSTQHRCCTSARVRRIWCFLRLSKMKRSNNIITSDTHRKSVHFMYAPTFSCDVS